MRDVLSDSLVNQAKKNEEFILLSGDHGYALFDALRKDSPDKFVNVGIMEQSMVGMAAGLAQLGYKPIVYGLASFVPIRVLEQIKLDICFSKSCVKFIGDGAGVVYSYLGNSHFCAEDLACLMAMPHIEIYTPGDANEMAICLDSFHESKSPAYLRIGKSDNPETGVVPKSIEPYFTNKSDNKTCLVSMGSMNGISAQMARKFDISHLSIMKLKPISTNIINLLENYDQLIFIEEHQRYGGLKSVVMEEFFVAQKTTPNTHHLCFQEKFIEKCGSYQYALSEHGLSFDQIENRLSEVLCKS